MLSLKVVSAKDLCAAVAARRPDHIISVIPEWEWCGVAKPSCDIPRTVVSVIDTGFMPPPDTNVIPARFAPTSVDVATVLRVGRSLLDRAESRDIYLLIHCKAGVCRSTSVALLILALQFGPGREREAVARLLEIAPCALPNGLVVELGDAALGRGGALIEAWRQEFVEGPPLRLPSACRAA